MRDLQVPTRTAGLELGDHRLRLRDQPPELLVLSFGSGHRVSRPAVGPKPAPLSRSRASPGTQFEAMTRTGSVIRRNACGSPIVARLEVVDLDLCRADG